MVQQYRMERGTADGAAVRAGHPAVRVEQTRKLQEHRADGASELEPGAEHQGFRSEAVRTDQVSFKSCLIFYLYRRISNDEQP